MEPGPGGRSAAREHGAGPASTPPPREQERKLEQEKLSGVVKSVHRRLRKKYREGKQRTERGEGEASSPPAPCQPLPSPKGPPLQPEGAARQPLPGPLSQARTPPSRSSPRFGFRRPPPAPFSSRALQESSRPVEEPSPHLSHPLSPAWVLRLSPHTRTQTLTQEVAVYRYERLEAQTRSQVEIHSRKMNWKKRELTTLRFDQPV